MIFKQLTVWAIVLICCSFLGRDSDLVYTDAENIPLVVGSLLGWVIYYIIIIIIAYLYATSGSSGLPAPQAKQFDAPDLNASNPIPVMFGTQWVNNMNVVWYGDIESTPWEKCS